MSDEPAGERHASLDVLAEVMAERIARQLAAAIEARGSAALVVSGGRSPAPLFERLSAAAIDWSRVHVSLADERWVSVTDAASNERLVRETLLRGRAAAARFTGLKNGAATPAAGAAAAWSALADMPRPVDLVLLGMGDDGHTASLFPDSPDLDQALDPAAAPACVGLRAPTVPHERISLNLSALLDSRRIVVLITGESKWRTYHEASGNGAVQRMPVRAVLRQQRTPVDVVWAP